MPNDEDDRKVPTFSAIFRPLAAARQHLPNRDLLALPPPFHSAGEYVRTFRLFACAHSQGPCLISLPASERSAPLMETAPDSLSSSFLKTELINVTSLSHRAPSPIPLYLTGGAPNRSQLSSPRAQNGQLPNSSAKSVGLRVFIKILFREGELRVAWFFAGRGALPVHTRLAASRKYGPATIHWRASAVRRDSPSCRPDRL